MGSDFAPNLFARIIVPSFLKPRRVQSRLSGTFEPIDIGDGLVAWQEYDSDPTRPLALFVHGFNGNHTQWSAIEKVVREAEYRTIFLDPPGHGSSRPGQCDPIIFSNAVRSAFEYFGPISLYVGHSMGAIAGVLGTRETAGVDAYSCWLALSSWPTPLKLQRKKLGLERSLQMQF